MLFSKEITLLVTVFKLVNKGDDRYKKCAKCKQLCICDHAYPPSLHGSPLGKLAKGGPSAVVVPLPGTKAMAILAHSVEMRKDTFQGSHSSLAGVGACCFRAAWSLRFME